MIDFAAHTNVYTQTSELNGRKASRRRQSLTVVSGAYIKHSKLFPNKDIVARVILEGKRGARYDGFVHQSGVITVIS